MDIRGLGYLGVRSPNAAVWETWGPEMLGMDIHDPTPRSSSLDEVTPKVDGAVYLRMDDRKWRIAVYPGDRDEIAFMGWEIANRHAFAAALKHLEAMKVPYTVSSEEEALERGVQQMAYFFDPVGYRHEIFYGGYLLEGSFAPGRRPWFKGFRAGHLGIGHVVLAIPEFKQELDDFVANVLKMKPFTGGLSIKITGGDGGRVRTEQYRPANNKRSHNIVYMEKAGYYGLHHIYFEYECLDDLGVTYDLIGKKSKYPMIATLGRHHTESAISFYTQSPSGFHLEIGWDSMIVDDATLVQERALHSFVWGLDLVGPMVLPHLKISDENPGPNPGRHRDAVHKLGNAA